MAVTAAALVTAAIGAGLAISGAVKKSKAKKMAARNKRPTYEINPEEYDNLNLAESLASQGLSDSSRQLYEEESQRGLTASIDGILKGGGDVNAINRSYEAYNQNLGRLTLLDNDQRVKNIMMLVNQRNRMSDQRDKDFQINKYAPYADTAQAAKEMAAAGDAQMWQGISTVGSAVGSYAGGMGGAKNVASVGGGTGAGIGIGGGASNNYGLGGQQRSTGTNGGIGGGASSNYGLGSSGSNPPPNLRSYNSTTGTYNDTGNWKWDGLSPEAKASLTSLIGA